MSRRRLAPVSLAVIALAGAACRMGQPIGQPIVNTEPEKSNTPGTIAGAVRTTANDPLPGRRVEAVNTETGQKYSAVTGVTGGFSIKVPPGKYRLELELRAGEDVAQQPGIIDINKSDLDPDRDIIVR